MARVELEFVGFKNTDCTVAVNGELVAIKKNRNRKYSCIVKTKGNRCDVVIHKSHSYAEKNWFWWNFLYFLLSIFGLFDVRQNKKFLVQDCRFIVKTDVDAKVLITRTDFEDGGRFVEMRASCEVVETSNVQYYDKEAKAKHKKMKPCKIITTVLAIALAIALIVLL